RRPSPVQRGPVSQIWAAAGGMLRGVRYGAAMKIHALVSLLCLTGAAGLAHTGPAHAELVVEDGKVAVAPTNTPEPPRGALMKTVEKQFGPPAHRHPTVGKPPITRWD